MVYDWPVYYSWAFLATCVALSAGWLLAAPALLKLPRASTKGSMAVVALVAITAVVCLGSLVAFPTAPWGTAAWFVSLAIGFRASTRFRRMCIALAVAAAGLMMPFFIGALTDSISDWLSFAMGLGFLGMVALAPFSATLVGVAVWLSQPPKRLP